MGAQTGESIQSTLHPHSQSSDLSIILDPVPRPNFLSPYPQPHASSTSRLGPGCTFCVCVLSPWARMQILCLCTISASSVSLINSPLPYPTVTCYALSQPTVSTSDAKPMKEVHMPTFYHKRKILKIKAVCSL